MTNSWARIRKLESIFQARALPPAVFRYGYVQRLPKGTSGERHVAVSKSEPTALANVERCEFEERDGPAPASSELSVNVYLSFRRMKGITTLSRVALALRPVGNSSREG